ncbi:Phosphatidylinositol 4-phosphate 5-kinase type-1 beta [Cytospora mali]|uniref:Phosphatidylinositol 4-phosphate 5-kinase type-1 beta n=1 Tax=Cytospora mali TaxID=578113 RepID=A0A194V2G0_CYTMA|nr:Phosphatidylinositol 4-phosphate 5-kinase type-1 beta [Valsa mali var. pyri (nom. inval.)]
MGRQEAIARSIVRAIIKGIQKKSRSPIAFIIGLFSAIFSFYELPLHKHRPDVFSELCRRYWNLDDEEYVASFRAAEGSRPEEALETMGDMGFSGSTFFATSDGKYLVKSVSRYHEHTFFRDDLLDPYAAHMATHPKSLLVRIVDFLASSGLAIGHRLGMAPSHHIIMENIMYGKDEADKAGKPAWEQWDLKPTSYFYPERDIAEGRLTSEATKSQLADEFHDRIILSKDHADEFWRNLDEDTRLLAHYNAVDYSLFLVRIPTDAPAQEVSDPSSSSAEQEGVDVVPTDPPAAPPSPPSWRTGIPSTDGKYIYRAAILDFFWAKHKVQPQLMTFLINAYNKLIHHHGPMSITTTPDEYRERFLKLCHEIVEIKEDEGLEL